MKRFANESSPLCLSEVCGRSFCLCLAFPPPPVTSCTNSIPSESQRKSLFFCHFWGFIVALLPARGKPPAPLRKCPSLSSCPGLLARCLSPSLFAPYSPEVFPNWASSGISRKEIISSSSHKSLPDTEQPGKGRFLLSDHPSHEMCIKPCIKLCHRLTQTCN